MDKETIIKTLESNHLKLNIWIRDVGLDQWEKGPQGKWTVGQHILHLVISDRLLNKALATPKFFLKYKFGTANRPSRSYEDVAKRYQERLLENIERSREFNKELKKPSLKEYEEILETLQILNKKLQYKTRKLKDEYLDTLLLPHPLMGRMTLREIIMWSSYHTEHHLQILKEKYTS